MEARHPDESSSALDALFENRIDEMLEAAHAACLRRLPWRPEEHERLTQEVLQRILDEARSARLDLGREDLASYVYKLADHAIRTFKRQWSRAVQRQAALPEDDVFSALLDDSGPGGTALEQVLEDEERSKLFGILRYAAVHLCFGATEKQRERAVRDTYIVVRHDLRGVPLATVAQELDLTPSACSYARERALEKLRKLLDEETGEARSFVQNSECFESVSELTSFLRLRMGT